MAALIKPRSLKARRATPLLPRATIPGICLFLVLLAGAAITLTYQNAVQHHREQARLAGIIGEAHLLKSLGERIESGHEITPEMPQQVNDIRAHLVRELDELVKPQMDEWIRADEDGRLSEQVRDAFHDNERSKERYLRLLAQNKVDEAEAWDEERLDPGHEAFIALARRAERAAAADAAHASRLALVGTFAALISSALALALLFGHWERAQRHAATLAGEQVALRQSEERLGSLIRNASDVIAIADANATLRYLSPAAQRLWGHLPETLLGQSPFRFVHVDDLAHTRTLFEQVCADSTAASSENSTELRLHHADGSWRNNEVVLTNLLKEPGIEGVLVTYRDITERKQFEQQLAHQAFHDALTGLPNRALFLERLRHALTRACRHKQPLAVLFLDLDNFKVINDSLGHEAGDRLLMSVAERLQACVRPGDTVARLGGDEFTILLDALNDQNEASLVAGRIIESMGTPVRLAGHDVMAAASIGIALSQNNEKDPDGLLRDADTAMYQAKTGGKNRCVVFDRSMNHQAIERLELEEELRRALEDGQFRLHYQPVVQLASGKLSELEALVRWEHPTRGLVAPAKFIPIAEETGLIVPLGKWVLETACRQATAWHARHPLDPPLVMSVNLSARQLQQPDLVDEVAHVLLATGWAPAHLKLEITESLMMADAEATAAKLQALKALGVRLAVDDFGTGYSSMAYLSNFPLDTLKIDRSFVSRLGQPGEDGEAIVRAIVTLAKTLGLQVTSEGIETKDQLSHLQALGCDQGQGYLFSKPLTSAEVDKWLAKSAEVQTLAGRRSAETEFKQRAA